MFSAHGHVRVQRVALKNHRESAPGGSHFVDRAPSIRRSPEVISSRPAIIRSSVDLPQPEGPTKTTIPGPGCEVDAFDDLRAAIAEAHCFSRPSPCGIFLPIIYFTAPKVRPRTSWFWLSQPRIRMGGMASVEAAERLAKNRPSGLENEAMNAVSGAAFEVVRVRLQNASFHVRMTRKQACGHDARQR